MTKRTTPACPVAELAHRASGLVGAFTEVDRTVCSTKTADTEAARSSTWERLVEMLRLAASRTASDPAGAFFQIDVATCALRDVGCYFALASRVYAEMVAGILDRLRDFLVTTFPGTTDPAEAFFA